MDRKLKILLCLPIILWSGISQGFEVMVNGFGNITAERSNLPKIATNNIPVYPPVTQDIAGGNPGVARVLGIQGRPDYWGAERRWNYYRNSKLGLQFTAILDDKFKAVTQVVGRGEYLTSDHFKAKMEWAYIQYDHNDSLDIQIGRFRTPAFLFSDYLDVTHAQPWVSPPDEVYSIVGRAFRNLDGIKFRYKSYISDWTLYTRFYTGNFEEAITLLGTEVVDKVRDIFGLSIDAENETFNFHASIMRAVYDVPIDGTLKTLLSNSESVNGRTSQSLALSDILQDRNEDLIYIGLAAAVRFFDNYQFLGEYASILSPGIMSTSRKGYYASLVYERDKWSLAFTYGFTRPLNTDIRKYEIRRDFLLTTQAQNSNIGANSAANNAFIEQLRSSLEKSRSYGVDGRYDITSSVALKASVRYVRPLEQGSAVIAYVGNGAATQRSIWVYKLSADFVF